MAKKHTIEMLQEYAKSRGGKCLSKVYINSTYKYKWQCSCGYTWEAKWNIMKNTKTWCRKCANRKYTIEDLKAYAKKHEGECLSDKYINGTTKYKWKCKYNHNWESQWNYMIKDGSWCSICGRIQQVVTVKNLTGEEKEKYTKFMISKKTALKKHYGESISSVKACKIISCQPAQQKWNKIRGDYPEEPVKSCIIKIEKLMYKKHIYAKPSVVVAVAMFIELDLKISKLCINQQTARTLLKKLDMWNNIKEIRRRYRKKVRNKAVIYTLEDLQKYANSKGGKCLDDTYINKSCNYTWECGECGNIWGESWSSALKLNLWCRRCTNGRTFKILKKYAEDHNGKILSTKYVRTDTLYKWECNECGSIWYDKWYNIKSRNWFCNSCKQINAAEKRKQKNDNN